MLWVLQKIHLPKVSMYVLLCYWLILWDTDRYATFKYYFLSWQSEQFIWFRSILWDVDRYPTFKYYWYWLSNKASSHSRIWGAENNRKTSSSRSCHWGRCWLSINHLGSSGFKTFVLRPNTFQSAHKTLYLRWINENTYKLLL